MQPVEVVAAVFQRGDTFLACRKKNGLPNAGQWEFPGGKRKPHESLKTALKREIVEELGVTIKVGPSLGCNICETGSTTIELHCYLVSVWQGDFVLTDHDELQWCSMEGLRSIRLSDADVPFVNRIGRLIGPS